MALVIATVNMKGGVGKTTLSVNLATCLAKDYQKRVLVVDLDTQISATLSLMSPYDFAKVRKERKTLRSLIYQSIKPAEATKFKTFDVIHRYACKIKGLDLLPGDIDLYDEFLVSEMLYEKAIQGEQPNFSKVWDSFENVLIRRILDQIHKDYDFIILDCAPGYNLLTRSGLVASNYYILPARPEPLSVVGIQLLERRIIKLKENHSFDGELPIRLLGIIFILSGGSLTGIYYRQVIKRVIDDFSIAKIFQTRIPLDVNVAKAVDSFMPVVLTNPNSPGSKAFNRFTKELLQKIDTIAPKSQTSSQKINFADLD